MVDGKRVGVIVPAAGIGSRMQSKEKKQFMLLEGQPVIYWTLKGLLKAPVVDELIIVVGQMETERMTAYLQEWMGILDSQVPYKVVVGGDTRQDSVFCGLKAISPQTEYVAIHDAVRPFVDGRWIEEMIHLMMADSYSACTVGQPIYDTIKRVDSSACIIDTVDRQTLMSVQTPQVFSYKMLYKAHVKACEEGRMGTDDTHLLSELGERVKIINKGKHNIKITTPYEWEMAQILLKIEE